jgi:hypothetical protein
MPPLRTLPQIGRDIVGVIGDHVRQYLRTELLKTFELSLERANNDCMESQKTAQDNFEYFAHMSHELR